MPLCTRLPSFYFRLPDEHLQFGEEQDQHQSQQLNTNDGKGIAEEFSQENIRYQLRCYLIPSRVVLQFGCAVIAAHSRDESYRADTMVSHHLPERSWKTVLCNGPRRMAIRWPGLCCCWFRFSTMCLWCWVVDRCERRLL